MCKSKETKSLESIVKGLMTATEGIRTMGLVFDPSEWHNVNPIVKALEDYSDKLQESRKKDNKVCKACRASSLLCAMCDKEYNRFNSDYCYDDDSERVCLGCGEVHRYADMCEDDKDRFCNDCNPWTRCENGHRHPKGDECQSCKWQAEREAKKAQEAEEAGA